MNTVGKTDQERGLNRATENERQGMISLKSPVALGLLALIALSACDENGEFQFPTSPSGDEATATAETATAASGAVVEQDVEAPEVFQTSEAGLWDGRPSFGGVWVAHPDVPQQERALVRNTANGREVISALYIRERNFPGPRIQVSNEAAVELGMLAGQPVQLDVVVLRREEVMVETAVPVADSVEPEDISSEALDPLVAAAAAIDEAEQGTSTDATALASVDTAPAASPVTAPSSSLDKPFVQIGIFSVEANANNTAASLRNIGIVPTVRREESRGKEFWRVIVGPSTTSQDRAAVLRQVKELGFTDAYFVSS